MSGKIKTMRLLFIVTLLVVTVSTSISCQKEDASPSNSFYGQWKTSYEDTISFSRENGKNILTYNQSMNPNLQVDSKKEFTYRDNKLGILDGLNGNDFRMLQTFKWNRQGRSFEVQGVEWFLFVNSTNTYFTFTKF